MEDDDDTRGGAEAAEEAVDPEERRRRRLSAVPDALREALRALPPADAEPALAFFGTGPSAPHTAHSSCYQCIPRSVHHPS